MKELTFREVIANIKEGEVWENERIKIETNPCKDFKITFKDGMRKSLFLFDNQKFKLIKKEEITFNKAFEAYEEGKKIESCESGYKYCNNEGECYIQRPKENVWERWFEDTFELTEIRGKWYIN